MAGSPCEEVRVWVEVARLQSAAPPKWALLQGTPLQAHVSEQASGMMLVMKLELVPVTSPQPSVAPKLWPVILKLLAQ